MTRHFRRPRGAPPLDLAEDSATTSTSIDGEPLAAHLRNALQLLHLVAELRLSGEGCTPLLATVAAAAECIRFTTKRIESTGGAWPGDDPPRHLRIAGELLVFAGTLADIDVVGDGEPLPMLLGSAHHRVLLVADTLEGVRRG